jgi:hypothetical protein
MFKKARWQKSKGWQEFLKHYDEYASEYYGDGEVRDLQSRFGSTRVYLLGNPQNPPVYLFHGNNENPLAFTDWLVPHLKKDSLTDLRDHQMKSKVTSIANIRMQPAGTADWSR